jgi:cytochrome c oxidase assembly protein Cox11
MEKDVRKTIALWVIICFVVFSFGYAMVPLSNAIHRYPAAPVVAKPVPAKTNTPK